MMFLLSFCEVIVISCVSKRFAGSYTFSKLLLTSYKILYKIHTNRCIIMDCNIYTFCKNNWKYKCSRLALIFFKTISLHKLYNMQWDPHFILREIQKSVKTNIFLHIFCFYYLFYNDFFRLYTCDSEVQKKKKRKSSTNKCETHMYEGCCLLYTSRCV